MGTELSAWINNESQLPALSEKEMGAVLVEAGEANTNGGGQDFLKFNGKTGRWTSGRDQEAVDEDQLFIVEPGTFFEGWTFWISTQKTPLATVRWSVYKRRQQSIHEDDLDDPSNGARLAEGDGWKATAGFQCMTIEGKPLEFNNNSKSGVGRLGELFKECGSRAMNEEPNIPVMALGDETFDSHGQTNYKPVWLTEAWVYRDVMMAYAKGEITKASMLKNEIKKKKPAKKK